MKGNWVVGIDAGGTSTKAILANRRAEIMSTTTGRSFNLRRDNLEHFSELISSVTRDLFGQIHLAGHLPSAVAIGVAGAGLPEEREALREIIQARFPQCLALVHHDAFVAQYGAFSGGPGILITAGTGSIAYGVNKEKREARAGGWGWMLGDEGSGWWIGREAIRAALASWEGSGPSTELEEMVRHQFEIDSTYDIVPIVYQERFDRFEISDLSKHVSAIARTGDEVAKSILKRAGCHLGKLGVNVAKILDIRADELVVALLGSVGTGAGQDLRDGVRESLMEYAGVETLSDTQAESDDGTREEEIAMPKYPVEDTTIIEERGPRLIEPIEDAVHGAIQWAIDSLNRPRYA